MQTDSAIASLATSAASPARTGRCLLTLLGGVAFVLLATAVCVRPLFREYWTALVPELLAPPASSWQSSPAIQYLANLLAAGGIALTAVWVALSRRQWRFSGLEIGAILLIAATALSFPHASDKRVAVNAALGAILPLLIAAMLYQLLADRPLWRRALLAAIVAIAAASTWKSTAQKHWEYERDWQEYQQTREALWAQIGRSADDPTAQLHEARLKARQPIAWFFHPNVLASFLLLGSTGTLAALTSLRRRRKTRPVVEPVVILPAEPRRRSAPAQAGPLTLALTEPTQPSRLPLTLAIILSVVFVALVAWDMVVIAWIGSAGAAAGLLAILATAAAAWMLRTRPRTLAILLLAAMLLLQASLVVLALRAPQVYDSLKDRGGKIRSMAFRLNYWQGAVRMFEQHPLEGVGPGQFAKYYTALKVPYATEDVAHPHNWLLNQAAEWGTLGLLGLLTALGTAGWRIIRSLGQPADSQPRSLVGPVLPAGLVILACWALVLLPGWSQELAWPIGISLLAMLCVSLSGLFGRMGQALLLAGLVGFVVHASVEMSSGVPGALWPFWALTALVMAWASPTTAASSQTSTRIGLLRPMPLAAIVVAAGIVALMVRPLSSVQMIHEAQQAVRQQQLEQAVHVLQGAGAADPLDSAPLKAAALLRQRLARQEPHRMPEHFREAAALFQTAAQRDPASYMVWRNLAIARMYLATQQNDFDAVHKAVNAMQTSLSLYPNWPTGWLELASMASVQSDQPDRPALLRIAIDATDNARSLDDRWPAEDPRKFTPQQRTQLPQMRQQLQQRLIAAGAAPTEGRPR